MKVTGFRKIVAKKSTTYLANFIFADSSLNGSVSFRLPTTQRRSISFYDAFFVAAVPMAMAIEEDLQFEGEVSEKLFKNIHKIRKHINQPFSRIQIKVNKVVRRKKIGYKNGLFFTLGVDSFHSLFQNFRLSSTRKISNLVFVHGLLSYKVSSSVEKEVENSIKRIAKVTKTKPIFIKTNLRDIADKVISWDYYHGAAIAAAALFLTSSISRVYISNCEEYLLDKPWGTRKELDRLWSTNDMTFESIWPNMRRLGKASALVKQSKSRSLLRYLWVCYKHTSDMRIENCSKCGKCLRTYLCFLASGMKEPIPSFRKLNPKWLYEMEIEYPGHKKWERILNILINKQLGSEEIYAGMRDVIRRKKDYAFTKWREETTEFLKNVLKKLIKHSPVYSMYIDVKYIFTR